MKRRTPVKTILAAALALALLLTACGGKAANSQAESSAPSVVTAETREEVKALVEAFYADLAQANPVCMTSYSGDEASTVFTRDGDRSCTDGLSYGYVYYTFIEDGKKYLISDGETAYEDEFMYDFMTESVNTMLTMFVTGIFSAEDEDEADAKLTYSAARTEKTVDGAAVTELTYTISGETDGEAGSMTVTGTADASGAVTDILVEMASGEESEKMRFTFEYDGVSVELPPYTVAFTPESLAYEHVESPFATLQELIDPLQEDESLFYMTDDENVYAVCEKDGRQYQVIAPFPEEARADYDALDFFADDYQEKAYAILGALAVEDCVDLTDAVIPQEELDAFAGKTVQDVVDAGFEGTGWSVWEGDATLYFSKDYMEYTATAAMPEDFDEESEFEFEDLGAGVIGEMRFSAPEYAALPMR